MPPPSMTRGGKPSKRRHKPPKMHAVLKFRREGDVMPETYEIELRMHCENLPGAEFGPYKEIRLGLQKGEEITEEVPADAKEAVFAAALKVRRSEKDGSPVFTGPFAQGTPQDRFIYLRWEGRLEDERVRFGRAKVKLKGLGWDLIMQAVDAGRPVEVAVDLKDKKGGPACASLPDSALRWL
jgi:hypothetical protein